MKLIHCHIENFGKLHLVDFEFSDGCNTFLKENGWGKSTLAAFIKVMFYGFENERSRDDFNNERKRYRPWQGGAYGGSLTFEVKGREYLVTRLFGSKEKEDIFSIKDARTKLEVYEYSSNLGEEIFSIDRTSFERTVFLTQNDCVTYPTDRIHGKLSNLAEKTNDINHYEKADERLHDLINSLSPNRKTGALYRLREEITALSMEIMIDSRLEESKTQILKEKAILKEQQKQRKLADLYALSEEEQKILERGLPTHILSEDEEIKLEKIHGKDTSFMKIATGILFVLGGFIVYGKMLAAGIGLLLAGIVFILWAVKEIKDRSEGQILGTKKELLIEELSEELSDLAYKKKSYEKALEKCSMYASVEEIMEAVYQCEKKLLDIKSRQEALSEKEEKLSELEEKQEKLYKKYEMLKKTREHLKEAKVNFTTKYTEPLMKGFLKYYQMISGQEGNLYDMDGDFNLTVSEHGMDYDIKYLSAGRKDLTGICMRMAMVDAMYQKEKPFLILDDPFVNLDEDGTKGGIFFLNEIEKEYQILYFTCHKSRIFG